MICSRCNEGTTRVIGVIDRRTNEPELLCPPCYRETARIPMPLTEIEKKLAIQNLRKVGVRKTNVFARMRGLE